MKQLLLYGIIGIFNTFIGMGTIFLLTYLGTRAELANFLGYILGIYCSYYLNSRFTFKANSNTKGLIKFFLTMGIAYLINLIVLILCFRILLLNVYIAQFLACLSYTIFGFLLSKIFVFNKS
ncbi:GtrA family protein [Helicobacter sp. MIT 11-5569]|uniref:GtrA family protein n=1 Tax=Helicobacter sp. MIT 11-5569 TaxID=1548151 RepID=UPI00051FEF8E|nr:GtrA family protein [Helicobacter sp. MIT 11-5569]TLD83887.1 GtrA family protein [Helicobacter sp. MIT 11-5569]